MTTENAGQSVPVYAVAIGLDSAIPFDSGVDCLFYFTMLMTAAQY